MRAEVDENDEITITEIMKINDLRYGSNSYYTIGKMWVFDSVVVVRIAQTKEMRFYEKVMVVGLSRSKLSTTIETENVAPNMIDFQMAASAVGKNMYELYGIYDTEIIRYTYEFDLESKNVHLAKPVVHSVASFGGSKYVTLISNDFLILSCADCTQPGGFINFYNRYSMSLDKQLDLPALPYERYYLALSEESVYNM